MARETLIDIVSDILSDMTSDPVNSISDTFESQQIARVVKSTYFDLFNERVWPHTGQLFELTSSADSTRPTHMRIEEDVISIEWVKYNCRKISEDRDNYLTIRYMRPEGFIEHVMSRDTSSPHVETAIDYNGTPLFVINNTAPTYWTTFDDEHLVFDSYDSEVDDILQTSKTQVYGYAEPDWRHEDSFVPDLPSKAFTLLKNEAKSRCFLLLKEVFNQKAEQAATRQRGWLSREKRRANAGIKYPNYGRPIPSVGKGRYKNNQFTG